MKWCVAMKKTDETLHAINSIGGKPIYGPFGIQVAEVRGLHPAKHDKSGRECYFVEIEGSLLYYLKQLISLQYIHRSNTVLPYWISERGKAEIK